MQRFIALDLETTGFDPVSDYPIEIAAIKFDEHGIYEKFQTLINPGVAIPQIVTHITGITDEDIANKPRLEEVKQQILDFIGDSPIVGHNIGFDTGFLRNKGFQLANAEFDTVPLTAILHPALPSYSLETISSIFDIAEKQDHRALSDTIACAKLFQQLLKKIQTLDPEILGKIEKIFAESAPHIAAIFANGTLGGKYVRGIKTEKSKRKSLESEYERGIEEEIARALANNETLLMEIGIGKGKYTALTNSVVKNQTGKTLISVATPELQEHLFTQIFPEDESIVLVKEMERYLSMARLHIYMEKSNKSLEEANFMAKVFLWSTYTERGERDEINFSNEDMRKWENVNVNPWRCNLEQEKFFQKANAKASNASTLVCYHRALGESSSIRKSHIKDIKNLIVCEANLFEKQILAASSRTYALDTLEEKFNLDSAVHQKLEFFFGMFSLMYDKYNERDSQSLLIQDTHRNTNEWLQIEQIYGTLSKILKENVEGELLDELQPLANLFANHEQKATAVIFQNHEEKIRIRLVSLETMESFWKSSFFKNVKTKIFISSTMRVAKSFDYIRGRLSIEKHAREIVIPPKLSLTKNLRIIIPKELPDQEKAEYASRANAILGSIIKQTPGQTIAIFGSKRTLHSTYYGLATNLKRTNIDLLSQDFSGGKGKITEKYKNDPSGTVLFGTFSFLEKIELSRLPCHNLVFQKIPFDPPSDPLVSLQMQRYMDSFTEYSLPETILRFLSFLNKFIKNETENEHKNIFIFDTRILKKSWGKALLDSLPEGVEVLQEVPDSL